MPPSLTSSLPLSSKTGPLHKTRIRLGAHEISSGNCTLMAGPCAVESEEQIFESARIVANAGVGILRGGCFKPRTSPYSFQGLGAEGLELLRRAADEHGLSVVSEVMSVEDVDIVAQKSDMIQVGARSMQNFALLKRLGSANRPVLLKRNPGCTVDELLLAAEYILSSGNPNVALCERGIRSFEQSTRYTLDFCGAASLMERTHLPVIIDPSHAAGRRELVPALARAARALGADAVMVEVHPNPNKALSDGRQSLTPQGFEILAKEFVEDSNSLGTSDNEHRKAPGMRPGIQHANWKRAS